MNNIRVNKIMLYYMIATFITSTLAQHTYDINYKVSTSKSVSTNTRCKDNEFACDKSASPLMCISKTRVCDTFSNCENGSDEEFTMCQARVCDPLIEHKCANGQCVSTPRHPWTIVCDGHQNCYDGSDESHSLCSSENPSYSNYYADNYHFQNSATPSPSKPDYNSGEIATTATSQTDLYQYGIRVYSTTNAPKRSSYPIATTKLVYSTKPYFQKATTPAPKPEKNSNSPTTINNGQRTVKCIVPTDNEGSRYYKNETGVEQPLYAGAEVDKFEVVYETCEEGYYQVAPFQHMICDSTGNWKPRYSHKLCLKKCPPLKPIEGLNITCTYNCKNVDCSKPAIPGTELKPKCNYLYSLPNGLKEPEIKLQCLPDGKWDGQLHHDCLPTCGRTFQYNSPMTPMYSGPALKIPWNVAIYKRKTNNTFELLCSGTVIAPNLVVSSARCFWENSGMSNKIISDGQHKITIGNKRELILQSNSTQLISVNSIIIEPDYLGQSGSYVNDIAILVLSNKLRYDFGVIPACIDWSTRYNVQNGIDGSIASWKSTKSIVQSTDILNITLPYIDRLTCRPLHGNGSGFERYISKDKFCAGSLEGQAIYELDSGAGLTYNHDGLQFLTGVKSIQDVNSTSLFSTFTDITTHIKFIHNIYISYTGVLMYP